jgi:hypothetical protein
MKAEIKKSIGNTYLITVDGKFYELVKFKTACRHLKIENALPTLNKSQEL